MRLAALARRFFRRAAFHPHDRFTNRHPHGRPTIYDLVRWNRDRRRLDLPQKPTADLSPATPDLHRIQTNRDEALVTWIGHSTLLVQMDGYNILTDPHFTGFASPIPGLGPRRWQAPGVALADLPDVDLVLISHNHYDHLDVPSVRRLAARNPNTIFLVPHGMNAWFDLHFPEIPTRPMQWDECLRFGSLDIFFLAVQHWSKRGLLDTNASLWGGFALVSPQARFFFAGDLGYSQDSRDIGDAYGPFDLAAIPIGAYEPRWFMHNQHVNPEEAIMVHKDVRAKRSLGIHWGTFYGITDEPLDQPPQDLALAREKAGIPADEFFVVRHGESVRIGLEKHVEGVTAQESPQNRLEPGGQRL